MSTHDHGGHGDPTEPPAPPERIVRTFEAIVTVSVSRATWAEHYGEPAENDLAGYVAGALRTGIRGLIPSIDEHDGRADVVVRP